MKSAGTIKAGCNIAHIAGNGFQGIKMLKPYYDHAGITIINAHVLDALKDMEPESIQCCVTSPPYWGLRDYGLPPVIWDDLGDCEHEWQPTSEPSGTGDGNSFRRDKKAGRKRGGHQPGFCNRCGAWRGSLGLEPTPELYIKHMVQIFREVRRVLRKDGALWLNLGDSYAGSGCGWGGGSISEKTGHHKKVHGVDFKKSKDQTPPAGLKAKDLIGIPWRVALALQVDGWWLRSDIIWSKPNPMPESVTDRPTKAHEYIFLLTKSAKYYYDADAIKEQSSYGPGCGWKDAGHEIAAKTADVANPAFRAIKPTRNKRSVWTVATQPFPGAHFAVFPEKLIEPCILAGSKIGDTVLDTFGGSGTTARVAKRLNRKAVIIELNPEYAKMPVSRLAQEVLPFTH